VHAVVREDGALPRDLVDERGHAGTKISSSEDTALEQFGGIVNIS
jgi:hypothetical protein